MPCQSIRNQALDYLLHEMGQAEERAIARHLTHCADCQAYLAQKQLVLKSIHTLKRLVPAQSVYDNIVESLGLEKQSRIKSFFENLLKSLFSQTLAYHAAILVFGIFLGMILKNFVWDQLIDPGSPAAARTVENIPADSPFQPTRSVTQNPPAMPQQKGNVRPVKTVRDGHESLTRNLGTNSLSYHLSRPGKVNVAVYNLKGELVSARENSTPSAGFHHLAVDNNQIQASGVYRVKLTTGEETFNKMIIVMK